ncbi:uncharacterized protein CTRU02_203109 [Colletotrichum truncatum]|uniref:Uncharacterized protein n=1 Tax=Colletotrichum truncatum TaxID=5467 RepID=A0ACC3Z8B5_COLTU
MKSAVAAVGLMASLASASAYQPRHFHWRRDNSTAPAGPGYTTLTVQVTEVATVTSCAPTITNCPARSGTLPASDLITTVVTNTVVLTEVVCPVTDAASISQSVIQEHSTGSLPGTTLTGPAATPTAPGAPLTTAPARTNSAQDPTATKPPGDDDDDEDDDCPADGDVETSITEIVSTKTLTMTVGKGSTASVVTTAVETTATSTVLVTKPYSEGAEKPTGAVTGVGSEEPTTTTTATSTGTRTVTIKRPGASEPAAPGNPGNTGSGECPPAVTVTLPASTVYVTIGASSVPTAPAGDNGSSQTASAEAPTSSEAAGGDDDDEDDCPADEEDDDEDEDDCPADDVVTVSSTVTVAPTAAPFPTNGTSGVAQPTGAAQRRSNKLF